jgi:hypothetical protein
VAYRALLIRNWEYTHGFAPLKGPRNDLERMEAALTHEEFGLFDAGDVDARPNLKAWDMRGASTTSSRTPSDQTALAVLDHKLT